MHRHLRHSCNYYQYITENGAMSWMITQTHTHTLILTYTLRLTYTLTVIFVCNANHHSQAMLSNHHD